LTAWCKTHPTLLRPLTISICSCSRTFFDDANTLVHGLADFETHVAPAMGASSPSASERLGDLKPFHSQIILNESPKKNVFFEENELERYLEDSDAGTNPMLAQMWDVFS
ncbi:hypothetical protein OXX69_013343, partial [Metschnikowia pulcherrima]